MKKNWLFAGIVGLLAAILYFASVAGYAFPGESAQLIASWKGLELAAGNQYPLMRVFAVLLGGGNLAAPVFGILSVVSVFLLVFAFVAWRVRDEDVPQSDETVPLVAAIVASVVFMLTPGVRSAATHLEPRLFAFAWALLAALVSFPFFKARSGRIAWLFPIILGAMVGFGLVDSALHVAFLPFFVALVAGVALRSGRKPYAAGFIFLFVAVIMFLVATSVFGVGNKEVLEGLAGELKSYYKVQGGLFVAIFATVPFITSLFSSGKAFREKIGLVQILFHASMTFVVILAVATPLSPSSLMESYGICPVATSAFASAVAGYLAGYWWKNRKSVAGIVTGGVLFLVLAVTVIWNLFSFDGDRGAFADKVAQRIVSDLGDRRWLVTDGTLDSHLKLVAAKAGKDLQLISLARDLDEQYLAELGEIVRKEGIGGSKNEALQMSLTLGVLPFLQDWLAADPSVRKELAIFGAPDLWYSAGHKPVPEFLFFGGDESREPDWSAWKEFDAILDVPKGWGSYRDRKVANPVDRLRYSLRRHIGFVANNRGVFLQDAKRDNEAFAMYELVLNEIDHDNICAIFNEVAMVGQKHHAALAKQRELERMLKVAVEDKNRRYLLWRLGTYYGYIRNPDAFVRLGYAWARSGRPGDAISQIRRAIDFVPSDKRTILLNMLASLYASENDQRKSRSIYETVLAKNNSDHDALIGMMRLELLDGNTTKALDYLQRAAASAAKSGRAEKTELAMAAMLKGDLVTAKSIIKGVTDTDPKNMQAWSLLSAIIMQKMDASHDDKEKSALAKELEDVVLPAMEKNAHGQFDYYLQTTRGFLMLRKGKEDRQRARDAFAAASRSRPDIASTRDMVLGLDISLNDKESAVVHAKEVLRRNRNAPLANYVMGSIALDKGRYAEAEAFLRKAADAPQPVPLALNDLAEVLRRNKNFPEAERYARKATERSPGLYVAWETLGSILVEQNRNLDEAEAAIRKACQLSRDKNGKEADVRMLISLARVQLKLKDVQHAKVNIRKVQSRIDELSDFDRREFEELRKAVK